MWLWAFHPVRRSIPVSCLWLIELGQCESNGSSAGSAKTGIPNGKGLLTHGTCKQRGDFVSNTEKIDNAISAHTNWFIRLRVAINEGTSQFSPENVRPDNNCDFGKWLYGDFPPQVKGTPLYSEIKTLHAEFHKEAAHILELALKGKKNEALALVENSSKIRKCSTELIGKLTKLKSSC